MFEDVLPPNGEITQTLRAAAQYLEGREGVDLADVEEAIDEGLYEHAYNALREIAGDHATPFGFWVEMSRAAELMGMK